MSCALYMMDELGDNGGPAADLCPGAHEDESTTTKGDLTPTVSAESEGVLDFFACSELDGPLEKTFLEDQTLGW